jgi:hypothetical protein
MSTYLSICITLLQNLGLQLLFNAICFFDELIEKRPTQGPGTLIVDNIKRNGGISTAKEVQWDYKNLVKRKGVLERLFL